jgi:hypothetical protein
MVLVDMHRPLNVVTYLLYFSLTFPAFAESFHVGCNTWLIFVPSQELAVFSNMPSANRRLRGCGGGT